jgi:phospholipid transport system substrate-binding protein
MSLAGMGRVRRSALGGGTLLVCLSLTGFSRRAVAEDQDLAEATNFIRDAGNRLAAITKGNPSSEDKRRRLQAYLEDVVDVGGVAQFCLGRFWRTATAAEQDEYRTLFAQVLVNTVSPHLKDYPQGGGQGIHVDIARGVRDGSDIDVLTQVSGNSSDNKAIRVTWVLNNSTGQLRIVDIVSEGMSLRLTQRSDYAAFLQRHNGSIAALLSALRDQVATKSS